MGDGYSLAWRVYDAQYWGVPQRRKRVYLIADFASGRAGEVLFESESLRRDPAESERAWEKASGYVAGSTGGRREPASVNAIVLENHPHDSRICYASNNIVQTLSAKMGTGGGNVPMILSNALCIGNGQVNSLAESGVAGTLNCMHDQQAVCYTQPRFGEFREAIIANTLTASDGKRVDPGACVLKMQKSTRKYMIRRLTPLECCRLQGFPDWWCDGAEGSDSAQYMMWGNGIALPCAADVLRRIADEDSLFR